MSIARSRTDRTSASSRSTSRKGHDRILGATIVASRASELINEMAVIMSAGIGMKALAAVVHTYPAQSEAIMLAAQAYKREFDKAAAEAVRRAAFAERVPMKNKPLMTAPSLGAPLRLRSLWLP